jgi:sorbitol/mannitol transport system permease protein
MTTASTPASVSIAPDRSRAHRARKAGALLLAPSVLLLAIWSIVPLLMTLWYSLEHYNLMSPGRVFFVGLRNYAFLFSDSSLRSAIENSVTLVASVLILSVVLGTAFALLLNNEFPGRNVARLLAISPFFIMPPVAALIWKNLLLDPLNGFIGWLLGLAGLPPVAWFTRFPMLSLIIIVAWEWIPFATLILLTALQSLDSEQIEAARMDGAGPVARLRYIVLPHLSRPAAIVVMMETIFLLSVFAEILTTTAGGPGDATTTLTFLVYIRALLNFNIGGASAAGVLAIVLANIVAFFLMRAVARSLNH